MNGRLLVQESTTMKYTFSAVLAFLNLASLYNTLHRFAKLIDNLSIYGPGNIVRMPGPGNHVNMRTEMVCISLGIDSAHVDRLAFDGIVRNSKK